MSTKGVCHERSGLMTSSATFSYQVRSLVESSQEEAERYAAFKKMLRLNKKVWPSVSTCNQDLSEINTSLAGWTRSLPEEDTGMP
jgi:hypothetical protein